MYKVPKEEELRKAIYHVLKKSGAFSSLYSLRNGVVEELKKMDKEYTVSLSRVKVVAARSGFVKIDVKKKHEKKDWESCPVCGNHTKEVKNMSLLGDRVVVGYRCELCGYKSKKNEGPLQYAFHLSR